MDISGREQWKSGKVPINRLRGMEFYPTVRGPTFYRWGSLGYHASASRVFVRVLRGGAIASVVMPKFERAFLPKLPKSARFTEYKQRFARTIDNGWIRDKMSHTH